MDFGKMFETWLKVLTKPGEAVFQQERENPQATLTTALIWIVISAVVVAALGFISSFFLLNALGGGGGFDEMLQQADMPPEAQQLAPFFSTALATGLAGSLGVFSIILAPIAFLIGVAIWHVIASLLGGKGSFETYAYLLATFQAPLSIISALLGLIPLAACLSPLISIYQLVLIYFATKVAHDLSSGRALAVVLTPILVVFALVVCLLIGFFGVLFSSTNGA